MKHDVIYVCTWKHLFLGYMLAHKQLFTRELVCALPQVPLACVNVLAILMYTLTTHGFPRDVLNNSTRTCMQMSTCVIVSSMVCS